jgi:GTPase KRas protein
VTLLVGNKCDEINAREVSEEEANGFAKDRNIEYIETSAMNHHSVNRAFENIGKQILRQKALAKSKANLKNSQRMKSHSLRNMNWLPKHRFPCC